MRLALFVTVLAALAIAGSAELVVPQLVLCLPSPALARWVALPTVTGPAVPLRLASQPSLCAVATKVGASAASPRCP